MKHQSFLEALAVELDLETPASSKCLERIPIELFGWKPHEKSMEMGYLALLVAEIPSWITFILTQPEIDFRTLPQFKPATTQDLVDRLHKNVREAKGTLKNTSDDLLDEPFYLKANGEILVTSTRREQLETTINHLVHHRGQLTVYMRLNNIAVPSIYGPSADDRSFSSK